MRASYNGPRFFSMVQQIRPMDALKLQKADLRKIMKDRLVQTSPQDIADQSANITSKVLQLSAYKEAKTISVFLSMPDKEVSTDALVEAAFADGKKVFVPYIHSNGIGRHQEMELLELVTREKPSMLYRDAWGIPTLDKDTISSRQNALGGYGVKQVPNSEQSPLLDLILVPALAFDSQGRRLGHGKGFYDRYLDRMKAIVQCERQTKKMPVLVGLALKQQCLEGDEVLPVGQDDWRVDHVLSAS